MWYMGHKPHFNCAKRDYYTCYLCAKVEVESARARIFFGAAVVQCGLRTYVSCDASGSSNTGVRAHVRRRSSIVVDAWSGVVSVKC